MAGLFGLFKNNTEEERRVDDEMHEMPREDLFKLLSIFYTFNHGDRACHPIELEYYPITKKGGFDFETLTKKFHEVGYSIDKVVCVTDEPLSPDYVAFVPNEKEYEKRRRNHEYLPYDISYLVVSNLSRMQFIIEESMESIKFLADGGDKRAIETYNKWLNYKDEINNHYSHCPTKEELEEREEEKEKTKVKKRN